MSWLNAQSSYFTSVCPDTMTRDTIGSDNGTGWNPVFFLFPKINFETGPSHVLWANSSGTDTIKMIKNETDFTDVTYNLNLKLICFFFCLLYNINPNLNLNSADISGTHRFLQSALFYCQGGGTWCSSNRSEDRCWHLQRFTVFYTPLIKVKTNLCLLFSPSHLSRLVWPSLGKGKNWKRQKTRSLSH